MLAIVQLASNKDADAIPHISTGVLFGIVAAIQLGLDHRGETL